MLFLEYKRLTIKPWPPKQFEDTSMHFKYGSIGAEVYGYPYLVWRELPEIFKDRIPNGFSEFGFIYEPSEELPIRVSVRRYGVERVGFNCATCHVSTFSIDGRREIVYGAPAKQLDLGAYIDFLLKVSDDSALTPEAVFASAEKNGRPINLFNRIALRYVVLPRLKGEIEEARNSFLWMKRRPKHGPGRTDAGNFWRQRWGMHPEQDDLIGAVDHPSIWNQRMRTGGWYHWDGNNGSLDERNISAALAGGAAEWLLDRHSIGRVSEWLMDLPEPHFPGAIDTQLASNGAVIFKSEGCAVCHVSERGKVTPLNELKTDKDRSILFSKEMVENFGRVGELYSWHFQNYRQSDGYVNMPLDGIWMRGPFLHNGSVPTLWALLQPPNDRPPTFRTGCDSLDAKVVGFVCSDGFEFETSLKGNSNSGHEYGTMLPAGDKMALLEFLKSL